jgi:hypothetical protein
LMSEGKILPYLDIPFQHASPEVLRGDEAPGRAGQDARPESLRAKERPRHGEPRQGPGKCGFLGEGGPQKEAKPGSDGRSMTGALLIRGVTVVVGVRDHEVALI